MTAVKIKELQERFRPLLFQPFEFNGTGIELNYAARARHPKTWEIHPHFHPWFEFNYVASGSVYTAIDGVEFLILAGESYIIPPGVAHSHRNHGEGDDGMCIRFSLESVSKNPQTDFLKILSRPHAAPFSSGLERLTMSGGLLCCQAEFAGWLAHLYETLNQENEIAPKTENPFAAQVILYLEEYFQEKIKMEELANAMNTSYRTLSRRFKAETGRTISCQLTKIRLNHAKKLLSGTKLPLYEIAARCGYENEFYFSKIFKEHCQIPPSQYRADFFRHKD